MVRMKVIIELRQLCISIQTQTNNNNNKLNNNSHKKKVACIKCDLQTKWKKEKKSERIKSESHQAKI